MSEGPAAPNQPASGAPACEAPSACRSSRGAQYYACQGKETKDANVPSALPDPEPRLDESPGPSFVSFRAWAMSLVPRILRTRAPFAAALLPTLHISWSKPASAHALFPLPVPFPGIFKQVPGASGRVRGVVARRRVVHVIVVALNYLHAGRAPTPAHLLRRRPNSAQHQAFLQIESFVQACGDVSFNAGRRSRELNACLSRLCAALCLQGASADPYGCTFPGVAREADQPCSPPAGPTLRAWPSATDDRGHTLPAAACTAEPSATTAPDYAPVPGEPAGSLDFSPYGPLDPSRLKLHGRGAWDPYEYLPDSLALPFLSPHCLLHGARCPSECAPDVSREKVSAVAELAKLWDGLGLLWLEAKGKPEGDELSYVRVFNAVKNSTTDRQIGDRRGRNFTEFPVHAASAGLPTGPMLLALHADPVHESLCISVTDRRDYYHQFSCSRARARTNMLCPPVPVSLLKGTKAYQELLDRATPQGTVPRPGVRETTAAGPAC